MDEITEQQFAFLRLLGREPKARKHLPIADREQDRIRQQCRRLGYVEFVGGRLDGVDHPMGWRLTPAGLSARDSYRLGRG